MGEGAMSNDGKLPGWKGTMKTRHQWNLERAEINFSASLRDVHEALGVLAAHVFEQHQDDWDDALFSASFDLNDAALSIRRAVAKLAEGV